MVSSRRKFSEEMMERVMGLEPTASTLARSRSSQLSYTRSFDYGHYFYGEAGDLSIAQRLPDKFLILLGVVGGFRRGLWSWFNVFKSRNAPWFWGAFARVCSSIF